MNRALIIVLTGLVVLTAGVFVVRLMSPAPALVLAPAKVEPPAPRPVVKDAPKPVVPAAPEAPRRAAVRPVAPNVEPAPVAPPPLEAAPEVGTLRIESDVPGAQVFLDRQFVGAAPVTASNVRPGTHRLNVSAQGYDGVADTIEVAPGPRDIMVRLKEVRLDAKIDVVHKHRIGSCRGRLIATPQGLRYETSDKDDGFTAALTDVETLQVDYLEKNLRVKTRKGKRYDFTDPDGNADRLFVFHRDVEKARERLLKGDPPAGQP